MLNFRRAVLAGVCGIALTSACQAGTITASLQTADNMGTVQIYMNEGTPNSFFTYNYAGGLNWKVNSVIDSSGAVLPANSNFRTFCIDLNQNVNLPGGPYQYNVSNSLVGAPIPGSLIDSAKEKAIRMLWAHYYKDTLGTSVAALEASAAFQLAIWRIEWDWSNNKTNLLNFDGASAVGSFQTRGASSNAEGAVAIGQASTMLAWVFDNYNTDAPLANLYALTSSGYQDQITEAPEPASLVLGAVGSLLFGAVGWRRMKNQMRGL